MTMWAWLYWNVWHRIELLGYRFWAIGCLMCGLFAWWYSGMFTAGVALLMWGVFFECLHQVTKFCMRD